MQSQSVQIRFIRALCVLFTFVRVVAKEETIFA